MTDRIADNVYGEKNNLDLNEIKEKNNINQIKEEKRNRTNENSDKSAAMENLLILKNKTKRAESITTLNNSGTNKKNAKIFSKKKNDFLKIKNLEDDSFSIEINEKNDPVKNLENLVRKKYDLDLKNYFEADKHFYMNKIKEEENYMEATISKIDEFSKRRKFPEFYLNEEKPVNNFTSNDSFFFIVNKNKEDGVCNYLDNVPYLCPIHNCKRKFFSLKNLEEHNH